MPERWHRKFSAVRSAVRIDARGRRPRRARRRRRRVAVAATRHSMKTAVSTWRNARRRTPRRRAHRGHEPRTRRGPRAPMSSRAAVMSPSGPRSFGRARRRDGRRRASVLTDHQPPAELVARLGEVGAGVGAPALLAGGGAARQAPGRRSTRLRHSTASVRHGRRRSSSTTAEVRASDSASRSTPAPASSPAAARPRSFTASSPVPDSRRARWRVRPSGCTPRRRRAWRRSPRGRLARVRWPRRRAARTPCPRAASWTPGGWRRGRRCTRPRRTPTGRPAPWQPSRSVTTPPDR